MFNFIAFAMSHKLIATSYRKRFWTTRSVQATSNEIQDSRYVKQAMSLVILDTTLCLHLLMLVQHLDSGMIVLCRPATYTDRAQLARLIIRHLHRLMIVQNRCAAPCGVRFLIKLNVWSSSLAEFCHLARQVQFNCCSKTEIGFCFPLMNVKNNAN